MIGIGITLAESIIADATRKFFGIADSAANIVYTLLAANNASNPNPLTALTGTALTQVATSPVTVPVYESTLAAGPTLRTFAANTPVIPYAAYRDGNWYATDSLGNALATPTVLSSGLTKYTNGPAGNPTLAVIAEPSATNLCLQSQEFDATWATINATVDDQSAGTTAPDGTSTADAVIENSTTNPHGVSQAINPVSAVVYTASVFVKAKGSRNAFVYLREAETTGTIYAGAQVDLTTGATSNTTGTVVVSSYPNGWFRISVTGTPVAGSRYFVVRSVSGTTTSYMGDGSSGLYAWGAQLETGSVATTYIPTTTSTVTRAARYTTATGSNFSSNLRGQLVLNETGREQWVFGGTATAGVYVSATNNLVATDGTTTITSVTTLAAGTIYDWGIDWPNGVLYINGVAEATNAAMDTPSWATTVRVGADGAATAARVLNGYASVIHSSNAAIAGSTD